MADWVTPPTFVALSFPAAADFNKLRDDLNFLHQRKGCFLYRDFDPTTFTSGSWHEIPWDTEVSDPLGMHSSQDPEVTIPTNYGGVWRIVFQAGFQSNATGWRGARLILNGSTTLGEETANAVDGEQTFIRVVKEVPLSAADVITAEIKHTKGSDLDVSVGPASTFFSANWVSA